MAEERVSEEKKDRPIKPEKKERAQSHADGSGSEGRISELQKTVGNRAVQRLLVQLKGEGPFEVDDETAERINHERDGGQSLDEGVAENMGTALGQDFSDVRVHNSPEAADLSSQLNAKAFTTGKDIFFGEGAYAPGSSSGQELLAHELTHVVQQGSGAVGGAGRMTVNAPGDAFEQQADAVAHTAAAAQPASAAGLQRVEQEKEEEKVMMKPDTEAIQKINEDEDKVMLKPDTKTIQRAEEEEEEEKKVQAKSDERGIQRAGEEEEDKNLQAKAEDWSIQRAGEDEDKEKLQRQELPGEKKEDEET